MPNTKELINILRSFEPIPTRALRVSAETNSGTLIFEVFGPNTSLFFVDVPIDPRKASVRPDTSVTITAVASSWGFVGQVPPPGPFSTPLPIPPQRLALDTFHSWGCTLGDTIKVAVKTDAELAGRTVHGSIYVRETAGDRIIGTVSFTVGRRKVSGSFSVTNNKHKGGTYTANGSFKRDYKATGPDVDALPGNIGNIGEVKGEYEASWQPGPNSREQAWREPGDCKFKALKFLKKYAGSITLIGPEGDTFLWREKGHSDWK